MSDQRLPTPGGDPNSWGDILNSYLAVSHNSDGTPANNTIGTAHIKDAAVTNAKLDSASRTSLTKADSSVQSVNSKTGSAISLTAADVLAVATSALAAANGVATLDNNSKLTASQLPTIAATTQPTLVAASNAAAAIKSNAAYVCSGTNDEAMINNALATNLSVVLSEGTFTLAHPIHITRDRAMLSGQGAATIISPAIGFTKSITIQNTTMGASDSACIVVDSGSATIPVGNVVLENFFVEGANVGATTAYVHGVYFRGYRGHMRNIYSDQNAGYGFIIEGYTGFATFDTTIDHCISINTWLHGFYTTSQRGEDVIITACKAINPGNKTYNTSIPAGVTQTSQHGFALGGASEQVIGCHPYGCGGAGIAFLTGTARHKVIGCKIEGNLYGILFAQATSGNNIIGCNFKGGVSSTGSIHIYLPSGASQGMGYSTITGCTFDPTDDNGTVQAAYAIALGDGQSQRMTIVGNSFDSGFNLGIINNFGATGLTNGHEIAHNLGYITENSGTQAVAGSATSVAVTHNLGFTPNKEEISLTPQGDVGSGVRYYISATSGTDFTITFVGTVTAHNMGWSAWRRIR